MIPWVHEACKSWGRAQYRVLYGRDGWPSQCIIKQMMTYGLMGTNSGRFSQIEAEVLTGGDLAVGNAVKRLGEEPRALVTIRYVLRGPVKFKCRKIGMSRTLFYERIGEIHAELATLIEREQLRFGQNEPILSTPRTFEAAA